MRRMHDKLTEELLDFLKQTDKQIS